MKNVAVILAGGSGMRLGGDLPKQFLKIAGRKVIEHTIDVFQKNGLIDEICVVVHPNHISDIEEIVLKNDFSKVRKILTGGKERYHSSLAAIEAYPEEVNLIFHDSVRPLVNDRIINDCVEALKNYNAVDTAVPTTDTIVQVNNKNVIEFVPDRSKLRNGQTPQGFKRSVIAHAYEKALKDPEFKTTDDCGVVLKYLPEEEIYVVRGETFNMKLTYKEDSFLLDKLFQLKSIEIAGEENLDYFNKLKDKTIIVFGGTSGIGKCIVEILEKYSIEVFPYSRSTGTDVSDINDIEKVLKEVYEKTGHVDCVINTSGILHKQPLHHMEDKIIDESLRTNLLGSINIAKASFQYLRQTKGSLLLYTSSSYTRGRANYSVYSASKAAIVNLTQGLSEEWHEFGITVNCINPARTDTPMRKKNFGIEPPGTLLDPYKVADISLKVLCSNMTGEVIDVKL